MTNKPKNIGTWTESSIVLYLRSHGFAGADEMTKADRITLHGMQDQGDIGVCPGVMFESKGGHAAETASDAQIAEWLAETERERIARRADVAALIRKRNGKGRANAGQWWAHMPGWAFVTLAALATGQTVVLDAVAVQCPAVTMTLAELCVLLRRAGYGDPIEVSA